MFGLLSQKKLALVAPEDAFEGRAQAMPVPSGHFVNGNPMQPPFAEGLEQAVFGMGCFWGAERSFWQLEGVYVTAAGYAGGYTPNPNYREVCHGGTAHTEAVLVVYDPARISFARLLQVFWEGHNPTQGMRQGNDVGTMYRSAIYTSTPEQLETAIASRERYGRALESAGHGSITTEVRDAVPFYYAEDFHQQYLAKNPGGYCGMGGTGVSCPSGIEL